MLPIFEKKQRVSSVDVAPTIEQVSTDQSEISALPNMRDGIVISTEHPTTPLDLEEENGENFADVMGKLTDMNSEDSTAIGGIMELTRVHQAPETEKERKENLAYKSVVTNAGAFTAGQFMADYNKALGMPDVAAALECLCSWMYVHNTGKGGERAKQAFAALKEEVNKEFTLQKEAKGLLPH